MSGKPNPKAPPSTSSKPKSQNGSRKFGASKGTRATPSMNDLDSELAFDIDLDREIKQSASNVQGKRRGQVSINHLLNFSSPARETDSNGWKKPNRPNRSRARRLSDDDDKIHLKGPEFVNANYRFVVDHRMNYNGQLLDPNLVLEDASILRVIVPRGHHCPICLTEDIVAPRMVSCGHIFCLTCLLSFLDSEPIRKKNASISRYKECPLCSLYVKPAEIKPVLIKRTDDSFTIPRVGESIEMKLMAKPANKILPIPRTLKVDREAVGDIPWYSDSQLAPYCRFMKGGLKFICDSYEADKKEILKQFEEDRWRYNDDGVYVTKAIEDIDMKMKISIEGFDENYEEPNPLENLVENLSISKEDPDTNGPNCHFFYEIGFGATTRFFLAPLDIKVLKNNYGSYSKFPSSLFLEVENISYGHMVTEKTIKRNKYFAHLPLGTEYALIEANWKQANPEVYKEFSKVLSQRRKKNIAKVKKEDHAKKEFETQQELKTLEFFKSENNGCWGNSSQSNFDDSSPTFSGPHWPDAVNGEEAMAELEPHLRSKPSNPGASKDEDANGNEYVTTIWGTKILKRQNPGESENTIQQEYEDHLEAEEMIRRTREQESMKKKGRKKKYCF